MNPFIEAIASPDPECRDRSFEDLAGGLTTHELLAACRELDAFRRATDNLYHRVRACSLLYASYRFILAEAPDFPAAGPIPTDGYDHLLARRFEEAAARFNTALSADGPSVTLFSALARTYREMGFQFLADQVRRSVRASLGNQWMFRVGHPDDHPVRLHPRMLQREEGAQLYPILAEATPVRLDLSHSGWSDIFFLGMDFPEGARVLNISVDLGMYGRDQDAKCPVEVYVRAIPEPLLRLTSVDLKATKDVTDLAELFNFGNDYLSLLKAGIVASGLVPPSFEGSGRRLEDVLARVAGGGMGIELVTSVNDIPKGSRLAVSTNLLAGIIAALMRATRQTEDLTGPLSESERRLVVSRAILGEWLGGSGGGWQDSGGIWPGLKIIEGAPAGASDPEFGVSRGRLLPAHRVLGPGDLHPEIAERLAGSLVLIHGGLAQNVGPILEMVTERYLLRYAAEWKARSDMRAIFDDIVAALREGDIRSLAQRTTRNWDGPLKAIIPWVTNAFTETIIARARKRFGDDFWGFLMLGGMSGGGMAMFVAPERRDDFRGAILEIMRAAKAELEHSLPFAMDPVVYTFRINQQGTTSRLLSGVDALMPSRYYALQVPELVHRKADSLSQLRMAELDHFTSRVTDPAESFGLLRNMVTNLFRVSDPASRAERLAWDEAAARTKAENGFDAIQHEQLRRDLRAGRIGLAHNRLPVETDIRDVEPADVIHYAPDSPDRTAGVNALRGGRVAVLTLAAGVGSRWTKGSGAIKAINPFVPMAGRHRSFLGIHLAKSARTAQLYGSPPPHVISTSYVTHDAIVDYLSRTRNAGYPGPVLLSPGRSIGQRLVPMVRDLQFLWEDTPQAVLDEQKEKVRDASRAALMDWARACGEGSDYSDNVAEQRFNPPGHWYEVPNLLRNGVLARLLKDHPDIETIMLHNVDTLGADLDPAALGAHLASGAALTFEVVPRRIEDRGGGLARVNGRVRLLEGLAQPREEDELGLTCYNSMTTWIQVDALLAVFDLTRDDLNGPEARIAAAVREVAHRLPTYVTIKDVKRRWGHGQEDVFPVAQFEKIWSDMTNLAEVDCRYLAVPRMRGQQLKDPDELDAWARDGSRDYVERLCTFED